MDLVGFVHALDDVFEDSTERIDGAMHAGKDGVGKLVSAAIIVHQQRAAGTKQPKRQHQIGQDVDFLVTAVDVDRVKRSARDPGRGQGVQDLGRSTATHAHPLAKTRSIGQKTRLDAGDAGGMMLRRSLERIDAGHVKVRELVEKPARRPTLPRPNLQDGTQRRDARQRLTNPGIAPLNQSVVNSGMVVGVSTFAELRL